MPHKITVHIAILTMATSLTACGLDDNFISNLFGKPSSDSITPDNENNEGSPNIPVQTPVEAAISSGDSSHITDASLFIEAQNETIEDVLQSALTIQNHLFKGDDGTTINAIKWNPTHDAAIFKPTYGSNYTVLESNSVTNINYTVKRKPLVIAGEYVGTSEDSRYMAFASNPFRNAYRNADNVNANMMQFMENSVSWLVGRDNFSEQPLNVVIAQMDQSYYAPDEIATRKSLDDFYPSQVNYNTRKACNANALENCITDTTDLIIISQVSAESDNLQQIADQVESALNNGISVMYLHHDGNEKPLAKYLLPIFDISYTSDNYWHRLKISDTEPSTIIGETPTEIVAIQTLLSRLNDDSFSIDLSLCEDKTCPEESNFNQEFKKTAEYVRNIFNTLDKRKLDIFSTEKYLFQKQLILLADVYRQQVTYPMDKNTTSRQAFLQSYFADHAVYNYRLINPVQADMGNFSRSDFSHITPTKKRVEMTSKRYFRAAGVYALPGQTVKITRNDNNPVNTSIFINSLRHGSTHQFSNDGYKRPKYLQTEKFPIAPGETIHITSAYGGPIQISFVQNNFDVSFDFENIGLHPFWKSSDDNDTFSDQLARADYNWVELSTPRFEVHSRLDKMLESIEEWGDASELAQATETYIHNYPHVLAGFQGFGIDIVDEIHDFARSKGWEVKTLDKVKHMNADQASCGYGCSGNPYDAYWNFSPLGHGDLHELGHGLERRRFRFSGWSGHASTNFYSYYSKAQYFKNTGNPPNCQNLPFEKTLSILLQSQEEADPFAYMQSQALNRWNDGALIYIQMMIAAQAEGTLSDGWNTLPRLHILEREFSQAIRSETNWLNARQNLGFSNFTLNEAKTLPNNDWLAIALTIVIERNMTDYLNMWGISIGQSAIDEINSYDYPAMPTRFFQSNGTNYCRSFDRTAVDI